jgi:hypothetical protein
MVQSIPLVVLQAEKARERVFSDKSAEPAEL